MVKKKSVKKASVKRTVKNSPKAHKKSLKPHTLHKIVPVVAPDHIVDMKKHTVKTDAPEIHVIGQNPKTAQEKFAKLQHADGQTRMSYEYDDILVQEKKGMTGWVRKYSPVMITLGIGLLTYFYLLFYMFYPAAIAQGNTVQFALIIMFLFVVAGILLFLGLKSELLFVRILSFIFVFVVFTFLLLFILVSYALVYKSG